ncbi:MAG: ATP-binding protein [Deltaproteobacteria bacterium]|nr:ATP-binding protein [Deltaproteobacteria bacterium]
MEQGSKILVVDDEAVMRDGCYRILAKEGCEVLTAANGEEGLTAIKKDPAGIAVVLLDLKMPGMGGMEVLEAAREVNPALLIVVITGYATVDSAVEAMKKGAYDFIAKPFAPDQLRLVVNRALEKRKLELEAEQLRAEAARSLRDVATEKGKVRTIVNCMADGILVTDREGRIVLTNPAAGRMLGIETTTSLAKSLREAVGHKKLIEAVEGVLEPAKPEVTIISQEIRIGESLIRAHTAAVKSEEAEVLGTVTVLEDMTYLLELDRMKGNFIAMVSHELRSPISAIVQNISLILDGLVGETAEKQRRLLLRAKERSKGLLDLIGDLLEISKIDAGMAMQRKGTLQVEEVVSRVVELMEGEARAKGISLSFHLTKGSLAKGPLAKGPPSASASASLPPVLGDKDNLEGVFTNLVSNAIKYTPEGGTVMIEVCPDGDYVKTVVQDTGIGISQEDLPRIFDKFSRIKSEKTRGIIGTGLGLSIVKGTVEAHLGSISVESEEGKGTTVTVLLPQKTG